MLIAIDAGHGVNRDTGASGCGLQEDKLVKDLGFRLSEELASQGHTARFVRPPSARSVNESLSKRASYANQLLADLYVSLHWNAFSNPQANGAEVWIYSSSSAAKHKANAVLNNICELGYRRRGIKIGSFAVLRLTKMPAMLVECCFITNQSDVNKYNINDFAKAIAKGILGGQYININKEKIINESIKLNVETDTYLKLETEQMSALDPHQYLPIKKGTYNCLLVGDEEGHYLIKDIEDFVDEEKEYFIYHGHCKIIT
ncbi:MAG: N-acetylmuramoyl-L-alanine amidase [Rivularia sp. (in: cyanobacteria)]